MHTASLPAAWLLAALTSPGEGPRQDAIEQFALVKAFNLQQRCLHVQVFEQTKHLLFPIAQTPDDLGLLQTHLAPGARSVPTHGDRVLPELPLFGGSSPPGAGFPMRRRGSLTIRMNGQTLSRRARPDVGAGELRSCMHALIATSHAVGPCT